MKDRNNVIDLFKFMAAIIIMQLHINGLSPNSNHLFISGYIYVEMFFMITGYFIAKSAHKTTTSGDSIDIVDFVTVQMIKKIKKIFPFSTVCIIIYYVFILMINHEFKLIITIPYELFLFQISNLGGKISLLFPVYWYLSAMLFVSPVIIYIILKHGDLFNSVLIYIIPITVYGYIFSKYQSLNLVWDNCFGIINVGILRAFAGITMGCLIYKTSLSIDKFTSKENLKITNTCLYSLLFILSMVLSCFDSNSKNDLAIIIAFALSLTLLTTKNSHHKLPFDSLWKLLGDVSMIIYLDHTVVLNIINYIFINKPYMEKAILIYSITIITSIILYTLRDFLCKVKNISTQFNKLVLSGQMKS